jgi:pimeloyl-ACP methyl ester carboxylesterase
VFAADLTSILDRMGAERAVVGGLSMGAGTALRFALQHPGRVHGLVLAAFPPGAGADRGFASVALQFADAIERDGLDAAGARFVWGPSSGLDPEAARLVRQGFLEHPPHGLALTLRGVIAAELTVAELRPRLAALRLPTLVVVGGADRMSLAPSRELAGAIPGGRLVVIEGAGHVVNLAQPGAFNAALEQFLTDVA